jgi:FecR protein
MRKPALLAVALLFQLLPHAFGQSVISARSGLVNFFEGVVFLDGQPLERKPGMFARLREGSTLGTQSGRAEVLLTPDTYLRIGEDSSIRMVSGDIDDTQVELLSGSAILDSSQAPDGEFVNVIFKNTTIRILKPGNYRLDAETAQLRVYAGEAEVVRDNDAGKGNPVKIEASQLMPLDGAPVVKRFTPGSDGLLDIWSEERGSLISSNMASSQSISDPLLDMGPAVPADLASYIGYIPMPAIPPVGMNPYGYGYPYPSYPGFSPYPNLAVMAYPAIRTATFLSVPVYGYSSIYSGRPLYPAGLGIGVIGSTPRPTVFVPRPTTGPRVGVGVHPVGRR